MKTKERTDSKMATTQNQYTRFSFVNGYKNMLKYFIKTYAIFIGVERVRMVEVGNGTRRGRVGTTCMPYNMNYFSFFLLHSYFYDPLAWGHIEELAVESIRRFSLPFHILLLYV